MDGTKENDTDTQWRCDFHLYSAPLLSKKRAPGGIFLFLNAWGGGKGLICKLVGKIIQKVRDREGYN